MSAALRQYLLITANYWAFTLTDGALRMLVVLYFYQLGYSGFALASLFLFYEIFGIVTNLAGGYLGARLGLNRTMQIGMVLQVGALGMLALPEPQLSLLWVMAAQGLSGIAKDLNKMSAKSGVKILLPQQQQGRLYHYVALLTGSKNALKGVGFFLGGMLLSLLGFQHAVLAMAAALLLVMCLTQMGLTQELGKSNAKPKFSQLFANSRGINVLSAARLFLFGARDVWFVIALPVFMAAELDWSQRQIGAFMAVWIIGYGLIQGLAPKLTGRPSGARGPCLSWLAPLALSPLLIVWGLSQHWPVAETVVAGLLLFGALFAINSSLHSYLILALSREEGVSLDVGFYYMANASGRLLGTLLSGALYQLGGLTPCLLVSSLMLALTWLISLMLPRTLPGGQHA
ncbi:MULTISPECIES: organoarsenical effux MFS transporter ArsJ [Ferrimonas]|uniref:organoarsenical effux MFS transporter ArsJ n=1 Tax=Ferrimonas TaxID=44011 RepID=UPI0004261541|nr:MULTISPECIES: organoarsenical effux MFS transporter ArsJ [Ferrimonas]USD36920.1 organoarsenical effux MFS transporter ArsJ [Ferrimonas sp. SCSIO 43195]